MKESFSKKAVGERLKGFRLSMHMTQKEFAEEMHWDVNTYRKIETGCSLLTSDKAQMLYDKYEIDITYLLTGNKDHMLRYIWVLPYNVIKSLILFLKFKPDVIVTTGAHTCVAMCYIAKIFKKKVIYIESFANIETKTLTGKLIYPIADVFVVQWHSMLKLYPKAKYEGWIF